VRKRAALGARGVVEQGAAGAERRPEVLGAVAFQRERAELRQEALFSGGRVEVPFR